MKYDRRYRRILKKYYIKGEQFFDVIYDFLQSSYEVRKLSWNYRDVLSKFLDYYRDLYRYYARLFNLFYYYATFERLADQECLKHLLVHYEKTKKVSIRKSKCLHNNIRQITNKQPIYICKICQQKLYKIYRDPLDYYFVSADLTTLEQAGKVSFFNFLDYIAEQERFRF